MLGPYNSVKVEVFKGLGFGKESSKNWLIPISIVTFLWFYFLVYIEPFDVAFISIILKPEKQTHGEHGWFHHVKEMEVLTKGHCSVCLDIQLDAFHLMSTSCSFPGCCCYFQLAWANHSISDLRARYWYFKWPSLQNNGVSEAVKLSNIMLCSSVFPGTRKYMRVKQVIIFDKLHLMKIIWNCILLLI